MLLLIPLMFFSGFELSFWAGEFTLLMDSKKIGIVMSVLGAAEVVGGLILGKLSDIVGRKISVTFALIVYCGGLTIAWFAKLHPTWFYMYYLAALCFGIGDSLFNTQIYASLGTLYKGDYLVPAFSVFQFFQNMGSAIGFFYSPLFPMDGSDGTLAQPAILAALGVGSLFSFVLTDLTPRKDVNQ